MPPTALMLKPRPICHGEWRNSANRSRRNDQPAGSGAFVLTMPIALIERPLNDSSNTRRTHPCRDRGAGTRRRGSTWHRPSRRCLAGCLNPKSQSSRPRLDSTPPARRSRLMPMRSTVRLNGPMSRSTLVDSSKLVDPSRSARGRRRIAPSGCGTARSSWAEPLRHRRTSCRPRRRQHQPARRRSGRRLLLGERPALHPEAVAVEHEGDVEGGLQLAAERANEGVTLGERQREVDRLDVETDRRLGETSARRANVSVEVDAVALAELHRLVLGPAERRRCPDHGAEGEVPPLPTDVGDVRVRRRPSPIVKRPLVNAAPAPMAKCQHVGNSGNSGCGMTRKLGR